MINFPHNSAQESTTSTNEEVILEIGRLRRELSDQTHISNENTRLKSRMAELEAEVQICNNTRTQLLTEIGRLSAELSNQAIQSARQAAKAAVSIPAMEAQPVTQPPFESSRQTTVTKPPTQSNSQAKTKGAEELPSLPQAQPVNQSPAEGNPPPNAPATNQAFISRTRDQSNAARSKNTTSDTTLERVPPPQIHSEIPSH